MNNISEEKFKIAINKAYQALHNNKEEINALNVFPVPDGDTGTNMSLTMNSAVKEVNALDNPSISQAAKALSKGSLMGARGNSGVILSQLFRGLSKALKDSDELNVLSINAAFNLSKETAYKAVMKPTEGTVLTVARKMAEFSEENKLNYEDPVKYLRDILEEGKKALLDTPNLLAQLKEAKVVDAGGQGLVVLLEGAVRSLENKTVDDIKVDGEIDDLGPSLEDLNNSSKEFAYSVEFIIKTDNPDSKSFYEEIKSMGNASAKKINDEELEVKSLTNHPGKLIEKGLEKGFLLDIEVKNILLDDSSEVEEEIQEESKKYGMVAVSFGDGFNNIFKELGVDKIIKGGQTMNPSTADIYDAVEKVNAENIIIFPNNKNIIMSAKQIEKLSDKNIICLETKSIPQAFAALLEFDPESSPEENKENMSDAIEEVRTIELTYSVRDTKHDGKDIKKGDIIGLLDGELLVNGKDHFELLKELIDMTNAKSETLITIYYGKDVKEEEANEMEEKLSNIYDSDIQVVYGGQPLYYYIVSVE